MRSACRTERLDRAAPASSADYTLIEITAFPGRSADAKCSLDRAVLAGIGELHIRRGRAPPVGSSRAGRRDVTVELDSLAELEPALAGEEFDVARVFVAYGASAPSAPDPCRLPRVAYSLDRPAAPTGSFRTGEWHETWSPAAYAAAIQAVREAIREGDVYQVNLVQHLWADFAGDPLALGAALARLRPLEPAPLQGDGWTIVSASPELLLQKRGRVVRTSPI